MKATEYYEKYKNKLTSRKEEVAIEAIKELLANFNQEAKELISKRHIRTAPALISVLKELNGKWNALARCFEKDYGGAPIKRDGFWIFWTREMPELKTVDCFNREIMERRKQGIK